MIRIFRVLAAGAALALSLATLQTPAYAARPTQLNEAAAAVGERWEQRLPGGQLVTLEKISAVESRTTGAVRGPSGCPGHPYLCAWRNNTQTGTLWIYNLNNVYANTANGVAHCWNMAADANNNTRSWYNMNTSRGAWLHNWVNCNQSSEKFRLLEFQTDYDSFNCGQVTPGNWCTTLFPTSIKALA